MRRLRVVAMIILILFGAGLAGCGGGSEVKSDISTATVGHELMDLKSAYEKGVITQEQYENAKERILKRE